MLYSQRLSFEGEGVTQCAGWAGHQTTPFPDLSGKTSLSGPTRFLRSLRSKNRVGGFSPFLQGREKAAPSGEGAASVSGRGFYTSII